MHRLLLRLPGTPAFPGSGCPGLVVRVIRVPRAPSSACAGLQCCRQTVCACRQNILVPIRWRDRTSRQSSAWEWKFPPVPRWNLPHRSTKSRDTDALPAIATYQNQGRRVAPRILRGKRRWGSTSGSCIPDWPPWARRRHVPGGVLQPS